MSNCLNVLLRHLKKKTWKTQTNPEINLSVVVWGNWRFARVHRHPVSLKKFCTYTKAIGRQQRWKAFSSPKCFKAKIPLKALMWKVSEKKVSARKKKVICTVLFSLGHFSKYKSCMLTSPRKHTVISIISIKMFCTFYVLAIRLYHPKTASQPNKYAGNGTHTHQVII